MAFLTCIVTTGLTAAAWVLPAQQVAAQNLFAPVIKVNEKAITRFEIDQRARLLTLFRAPGDPVENAREQLIEDRLKMQEAQTVGLVIGEDVLLDAMDEFAARANLELDEMLNALGDAGVEEMTFREYIRVGITWRELVSARFGAQISVNEDDMERARMALTGASGVRVLLSEIVLPIPQGQLDTVLARAETLAQIDNAKEFEAAARRFSASPTGPTGGRMEWTTISDLPPQLRPVILDLAPGEVTEPITTEQAIILLQMRDIAETETSEPQYAEIKYATYFIPGGRSEDALQRAEQVKDITNTCDDLYGVAQGQPVSVLDVVTQPPSEIPQDIAIQLNQLDPGEVSTALTRSNGQTLMLLMLCSRTPVVEGAEDGPSEEELTSFVQTSRLESFSNGYLARLKAEARIIEN
ncbi:MAG: peptidylprolyl isomerase [Pseudomonadota bacterium]